MRVGSIIGLVLASVWIALPAAAQQGAQPMAAGDAVPIDGGLVTGRALPSGVTAYLGMPYAAPPVRELRWHEPQPVAPWQGVLAADKFAPQCIQPLRDATSNHYAGVEVSSEDCLYLNVWTRPDLKKAPVIVYIHGGAFFVGAGSNDIYRGEAVSQEGAVFVNMNYRLGPLGFLALPELSAESPRRASGNYGFMDQIAALEWVKRNIARFGGDPDNVTIAGQSAGSMSVLALQASPLAKGLFHRAVGMSGAAIGGPIKMPSLLQAEQDGEKLKAGWKAQDLKHLRALPADRLVVPRVPNGPTTGPTIDGYVLPVPIPESFARKEQADVPLLVGFTHDESFGGLGPVSGLADFQAKAKARFGANTERFLKLYPAQTDADAQAQARAADRDATMAISMLTWANLQQANGRAPVFSYQFSRPHSYAPNATFSDLNPATAGAYHTSEVPFWLGTLDSFNRFRPTRNWGLADYAISKTMTRSLVAFARTGNPDTSELTWPRFTPKRPKLLEFGQTVKTAPWPDQQKFDFFTEMMSLPVRPPSPAD
ncbi:MULTISPECIES: carboxylesterase/lipase family protein [unclassified Azospirillum]|uniref:carboxylesterase/lipase family protein n=1 Tax=unclassified Azospirillum TaxID=2630922 RepID=UPI000B6FFCDC|nr:MULTISPECIES: carboxylesterase family protein [unclassified Azospirillum]SNR94817.1 para-nitrobenzyl esterase [Azospirillum sp. RU38E]SNS10999.1 para-nitrobenzyl esterase [Azospirillum sp. RU37A]